MARSFDELKTISKADKKKRFQKYFGEMELPEEEIKERVSLAEELEAVFKKLFVLLSASIVANDKATLDKQFFYDDALFQYQEALANAGYPDLADQLSGYIGRTTMSIVDTTIKYAETPYYVSDERSVFLAMDETNAVLNYDKEMKARAAGYTHKIWKTKSDARVRDTHKELNGKSIEIENTFKVGIYEMRFPLDVMLGAGPEEVCRCRCVCQYTKKYDNLSNLNGEGEEGHKGISRDLMINKSLVESGNYKNAVNSLGESNPISKSITSEMRKMLEHRNGTTKEDLVFINSDSGEIARNIESTLDRRVLPTKGMMSMLLGNENKIISIHNHPSSTVPSADDIMACATRKYKYGIIACHNGHIFKYSVKGELIPSIYYSAVAELDKSEYTISDLEKFANEVKQANVEMEVIL